MSFGKSMVAAAGDPMVIRPYANGFFEKEAKSDKARTIALPLMAVEELRRWRLQQAEGLLRLGVHVDDDWHVVTQADRAAAVVDDVLRAAINKRAKHVGWQNGSNCQLRGG